MERIVQIKCRAIKSKEEERCFLIMEIIVVVEIAGIAQTADAVTATAEGAAAAIRSTAARVPPVLEGQEVIPARQAQWAQ